MPVRDQTHRVPITVTRVPAWTDLVCAAITSALMNRNIGTTGNQLIGRVRASRWVSRYIQKEVDGRTRPIWTTPMADVLDPGHGLLCWIRMDVPCGSSVFVIYSWLVSSVTRRAGSRCLFVRNWQPINDDDDGDARPRLFRLLCRGREKDLLPARVRRGIARDLFERLFAPKTTFRTC